MARIVITSWGTHGDVDPYIALGKGLAARGHEPVLAVPAYYEPIVRAAGLGFHATRPAIDPADTALVQRAMDAARGPEVVLKEIVMPAVEQAYEDLDSATRGADLLLSHPVTFAARAIAEVKRLRWASSVLAPMSFFSAHDVPVVPPAPWLKTLERRLGPWVGRAVVRIARSSARGWAEPLHRLRARLGLPRVEQPVFEGQHSPRLVLAIFSRVLAAPQPDWPAGVRVTGQLLDDSAHGDALAPELERFLSEGDPPLVFTLGTSAVLAAGRFYEESIAAARRLGRRAVLLVGAARVEDLARLAEPGRELVVPSAPHSLLFPRAAAVVHQSGVGTLGQALRGGRPMLCVPFAHDQPDNAYRASQLGVARVPTPGRYRAARAAAELEVLLRSDVYERRAREVADVVRREDGVRAACDALEEVLADRPATRAAPAPGR